MYPRIACNSSIKEVSNTGKIKQLSKKTMGSHVQ